MAQCTWPHSPDSSPVFIVNYIVMGHQTFPPKQFNSCYHYLKPHEQGAEPLSAAPGAGVWVVPSPAGSPCLYGNLAHKSQLGQNHRIIPAGKGF